MEIRAIEESQWIGREQVFFVEYAYDATLNEIIQRRYEEISALYQSQGLRFIYLPALKQEVGERALQYAGGRGYNSSPIRAFKCIIPHSVLCHISHPSLVHYVPERRSFHIAQYLCETDERLLMLFFAANAAEYTCRPWIPLRPIEDSPRFSHEFVPVTTVESPGGFLTSSKALQEEDVQALLAEKENLEILCQMAGLWRRLEERGIGLDLLLKLMHNTQSPIGLTIYSDGIKLENEGQDQLKLATIDRAFYLLYLLHPEGIDFKEMIDHRAELLHIYRALGPRGSRRKQEETITRFVDPTTNLMSVSASRIKRAFSALLCEDLVGQYLISGPVGGKRTIAIDRSLVHWSDSMLSQALHIQQSSAPSQPDPESLLDRFARKLFGHGD